MKPPLPDWQIPNNLEELINADSYGIWDTEIYSPVTLSVMKGTEFMGRPIPLAWQLEFEPQGDDFEKGNAFLQKMNSDPDGYSWASLVRTVALKYHPEIANELQFGDTDQSACVVWVESEATCRTLLNLIWNLIYP